MKRALFLLVLFVQFGLTSAQKKFSFIYLPDIHLEPDSAILANFERIVKKVNKLDPDFVITGGDMIYTAKNTNDKNAERLFDLMDEKFKTFKMPVHLTMGNHEVVGILPNSGIDNSHPKWGKRLYQKRYGNRYQSFTKYGYKFFLLDGITILQEKMNYGLGVDSVQIEWIKNELSETDKSFPIVISIHSPIISPRAMSNANTSALTENAKSVLDLFKYHNLKMVLQGHNHTFMNLEIGGIHFICGGSTLQRSSGFDEGFIRVKVKKKKEEIEFIQTTVK